MDASAKAFEEWWRDSLCHTEEEDAGAKFKAECSWRASGRWHRLKALREAAKIARHWSAESRLGNWDWRLSAAALENELAALIAAEERKEER